MPERDEAKPEVEEAIEAPAEGGSEPEAAAVEAEVVGQTHEVEVIEPEPTEEDKLRAQLEQTQGRTHARRIGVVAIHDDREPAEVGDRPHPLHGITVGYAEPRLDHRGAVDSSLAHGGLVGRHVPSVLRRHVPRHDRVPGVVAVGAE